MKNDNNSSNVLRNVLILLIAVASCAAAIYLFRNKLKELPVLNRLFGSKDENPEFDVFDDLDDFDLEADDSDDKAVAEPVKEEKADKPEDKVRRGYVRLKFNQAEEA